MIFSVRKYSFQTVTKPIYEQWVEKFDRICFSVFLLVYLDGMSLVYLDGMSPVILKFDILDVSVSLFIH